MADEEQVGRDYDWQAWREAAGLVRTWDAFLSEKRRRRRCRN